MTNNNSIKNIISLSSDLRWKIGDEFHDKLTEGIYADASEIAQSAVTRKGSQRKLKLDTRIDRIVTSRYWGFPIMGGILAVILWLTIKGANYPSSMFPSLLRMDEPYLTIRLLT